MKKLLTFLTLLTLSIGVSWAATMTYTPTSAAGAGTVTGGPSDLTLTNTHSGGYSMQSGQGLQITTAKSPFTATISGMTSSYKVTKIVVTYCTNSQRGQGTISAKIGNNQVGSTFTVTKPSSGGTTLKTATLYDDADGTSFVDNENFTINITVDVNSIYLNKVEIVYEDNSGPAAVTPPTITLDPASGTYYEGDEVTVTLTPTTEGSTISYNIGDGWTNYTAPFTISETTTIQAKATLNGVESSVKTQDVPFKKSVANIAAFKALSDADAADFKFTGDVVVTYFNENDADYLWIKDNTGSTLLYQSNLTSNVEQGDIIGGGWTGNRTIYKGLVEIKGVTDAAIAQGSETVNPIDLNYTPHFASTDYQAVYGKLSGVTCTVKNSNNSNFTITDVNGNEIAGHDTYNMWPADFSTEKTYNITGIVSVYNSAQFIPVLFEEVTEDPGDGYYLVGNFNMDGNNWVTKDARYKFSGEGTTLTLNNITLPDNVQFKIVKWEGETQTWYGGLTDDENQQNPYGLHRDWHTNIPLTNSYGNNKVKNFFIAGGAVTSFTLDTDNLKFTVQRDAQLYFKCDKINNWEKIAMTATETGWTYSRELEAGAKFGFSDEWGDHHGNNWTLKPEHFGYSYDIPVGTENTYIMQDAGNYKLDVNSDLTVLHVNKVFNINCSANLNGGGTVVAKVNDQTVQSAMSGETVTIEYTTNNGYTFNNITLNGNVLEAVEGVYSFVMTTQDAEVIANYTASSYAITVESVPDDFGTVTCPATATTGQTVTFTVTPDEGYSVKSVTAYFVNGENNTSVTVNYNEETEEYSFGMPPFPVIVTVTYKVPLQPCTIRFEETWNETDGMGGNDNNWSGISETSTIVNDNEGWIYMRNGEYVEGFNGYGAKQCIRIGDGSYTGSATTPEIIVTNGTIYKMTFKAGSWDSDVEALLSATGAELYSDESCTTTPVSSIALPYRSWGAEGEQEHVVYVKATSSLMTITWSTTAAKKRYFLDEVVIDYFAQPAQPTSVTLAELCATGVTTEGENWYVISDMLKAVYADDVRGLLWCKDLGNQSIDATSIHEGDQIDFLYNDTQAQNLRAWDQSNWIVLEFTTPDQGNNIGLMLTNAQDKLIKPGTIKGKLINNVNYTLKMDLDMIETLTPADEGYSEEPYEENVYCPSNFLPENLNIWGSIENGDGAYTEGNPNQNYFFMNPKVQEVCYITYAEWNEGYSCFTVPSSSGFSGAFQVGWAYRATQTPPTLKDGEIYHFHAIVQRTDKEHYGPKNLITTKDGAPTYEYISVYPVDLMGDSNIIITAINTVEASNGEVKSVKYVNVAGMVSDVPFQGVNIVVTEYTDGSRTTSKMLKK